LSDKGVFRFEASTVFSSADVSSADSIIKGAKRDHSDTLFVTLGGRYGLTADTELMLSGTVSASDMRSVDFEDASSTTTEQQFKTLTLGVNHRFSEDNETPAFLGFAKLNIIENTAISGQDLTFGRTGAVGLTAYRILDPLILSFTTGYRFETPRDAEGKNIDPGDVVFFNPRSVFP